MLSLIFRSSVTRCLQVHNGIRAMSTSASPFTTLVVSHPAEFVTHVELNRPTKLNAMNQAFWSEMIDCFNEISADPNCRAVVVSGAGQVFTSGLDLMDMASVIMQPEGDDVARISWNLQKVISRYQETFTVLEKCSKPVIVAIHGACVGGGVDMITACDVRLCTQDAWFQVKEGDVELAADVGTLQRLPKVIGSRSLVNDMALTARKVFSDEARSSGLVSRVFPDKDAMMAAALEMAGQMVARSPVGVNNVLFLTIMNLKYPITTDVLYTIFNNCGCVQRITIFHKNKAMVEFDSVQSAQRARASLNGADIYSGCCTLKIEYAKPTRLKVFKNDRDTWDYTTPAVDATEDGAANTNKRPRQPALLGDHPPEYSGYHGYDKSYETAPYENRRMGPPARGRGGRTGYGPSYGPPPPPPGEYGARSDSPVVMVYGLDNKMNADLVFNIFCLYGNVERVKFIKSKPGAAMVEMGDCYAVDRAITHLNNNFLFGQKLNVCVSKQQAIVQRQSYELEDNSSSFKEFRGSRNNRFTSPEHAAKTGIQHPSNVLHFFNAQPDATTEIFSRICEELGVKSPANVKLFTGKSGAAPSDRSASGLLEWESINDAMEALALMNHYQMKNSTGPYPYTLRLCFSTVQHTN